MSPSSSRIVHYVLFAAAGLVVVSPALSSAPKDDFPLSTFPMFSTKKDTKTTVDQVVGVAEGREVTLGPRFVGTDEVLQARATISRAVRGGPAPRAALCREVAARVAKDGDLSDVAHVELRTVTHDAIRYFAEDDRTPLKSSVHLRCEVPQ